MEQGRKGVVLHPFRWQARKGMDQGRLEQAAVQRWQRLVLHGQGRLHGQRASQVQLERRHRHFLLRRKRRHAVRVEVHQWQVVFLR